MDNHFIPFILKGDVPQLSDKQHEDLMLKKQKLEIQNQYLPHISFFKSGILCSSVKRHDILKISQSVLH